MKRKIGTAKIARISMVDQVESVLKEQILSGEWKPQEKLPPEAEIAQTYGVNRLTVRMALQKLNTLGVTETRVGEGTFVRDFSFTPLFNQVIDYYEVQDRSEDIQEMRMVIEKESAVLAAARATPEELAELQLQLREYHIRLQKYQEEENNENFQSLVEADFLFHRQIVRMSKNLLFEEIYAMLQKLVVRHISKLAHQRHVFKGQSLIDFSEIHDKLYQDICNRDVQQIKKTVSLLLDVQDSPADNSIPQ